MSQFRQFLSDNKLWWILPIVLILFIVGYVIYVGDQVEGVPGETAPFNYDNY
jgi:hypothetical protein